MAPSDPLIGVELGNYRVEEKIAEGGMGLIYRAVHTVIGRQAAIKVLTQRYSNDQNMIKRLHREARAVNRIGHPSIVDIFDFGRTPDDRQYFAMEYLDGESLAATIERNGALPWAQTSQIFTQILDALAAAHDLGIVHRDIKPENILVSTDDVGAITVKVLDFGIAKSVGLGPEGEQLTKAGSVMGTPEYIAPEQIRGKQVDGRADLYAMGVILYEMVAGHRPYESDKVMNLLMAHLRDPIPPVGSVPPQLGVPKQVVEAIPKAMAKAPEDRFQDARSFAQALGLQTSALSSSDGTRPLPDMFWESDGSHSTGDVSKGHATAPRGMLTATTGAGQSAPTEAQLPVTDVPRRSPLVWIVPLALILISGAAIAFVALKKSGGTAISDGSGKGSGSGTAAVRPGTGSALPPTAFAPVTDLEALLFEVQKALREALTSSKVGIRRRALRGLGELHDTNALKKLFKSLKNDPDPSVQAAAARALSQLGEPTAAAKLKEARDEVNDIVQVSIDDALRRLHDPAGLKGLRRALKSANKPVRLAAALALADAGDKRARKVLEPQLSGANNKLMAPVLTALARLEDARALKSLRDGLDKGDASTRLQFAEALAKLGDERATSTLRELLVKGELPTRLVAAKNLATLGDHAGLSVMQQGARAKTPGTRMLAAEALGAVADRAALPALAAILGDADKLVRATSAESIARILALMPTKLLRRSQDWLLAALAQGDWSTRHAAVGVSGEMDPELAIELLGWAFRDKDARVRVAAIRRLARLGGKSAKARRIIRAALGDQAPEVRAAAAMAMGSVGDADAKRDLSRAVWDKNKGVGMAAAGQLLAMGDTTHLRALKGATKSKSAVTRARAIEALSHWKDRAQRNIVLRQALKDRAAPVRLAAALALSRDGDRSGSKVLDKAAADGSRPALEALLALKVSQKGRIRKLARSREADQRETAMALAVRALGPRGATPLLRRGARDDDVAVRRAAARGLASVADKDASVAPLLQQLARDTDPAVRAAAAVGLSKLKSDKGAAKGQVKPVKSAPEPAAPRLPDKPKPTKPGVAAPELTFVEDTKKEASYKELIVRAELQSRGGRYVAALRTLNKARRLSHNRPPALFETGHVHWKVAIKAKAAGNRGKARRHAQQARRYYGLYLRKARHGKQAGRARGGLRDVHRLLKAL